MRVDLAGGPFNSETEQYENEVGRQGNYVLLHHEDDTYTLYAHLDSNIVVDTGDDVVAGQQLGDVGVTGRTTGAHLHMERRTRNAEGTWEFADLEALYPE